MYADPALSLSLCLSLSLSLSLLFSCKNALTEPAALPAP